MGRFIEVIGLRSDLVISEVTCSRIPVCTLFEARGLSSFGASWLVTGSKTATAEVGDSDLGFAFGETETSIQ